MKFFLDTAMIDEIRQAVTWGLLDGITTNPSLAAKTGRPFEEVAKEILKTVEPAPVSLEVTATDVEGMIEQGLNLASWGKNVVVKTPMIEAGVVAAKTLAGKHKIPVNMTLVFSVNQALLAAKAGVSYVSPFVGRLDDIGEDGMHLIADIVTMFKNYNFSTQVLVASIRHPMHVTQAALMGAHVGTMPFSVMRQLFKHPLTDKGQDAFLADWKKVPQPTTKNKTAAR